VSVPIDDDLRQWLTTHRQGDEDLGATIAWLLTELWGLLEDQWPDRVLLWIPDDLQPWLTTQAQRYRSRGREQVLLTLLCRAARGHTPPIRPGPG
jgi:hypothetical protein